MTTLSPYNTDARDANTADYRPIDRLTDAQIDDLFELYQGEWWTTGRTRDDVVGMLARTSAVIGFAEPVQERLVAFARILSDGVFKALVFDVIVHREHRRVGLGRRLVESVLKHPLVSAVRHVELYCRPELEPFYEQWGFTPNLEGVRLMRRRDQPAISRSATKVAALDVSPFLPSTARSRSIE